MNDSTEDRFLSSSLIETRDIFKSCRSLKEGLGEGLPNGDICPKTLRLVFLFAIMSIDFLSMSLSGVSGLLSTSCFPLINGCNFRGTGVGQR